MIDQTSINLLDLIPTQMKKVASTNGGEYAGVCPMCGGKDRFRVQPNDKPNPRWMCRKCSERGGDPIAFLMKYQNLDFKSACDELRLVLEQPNRQRPKQRQPSTPALPYSQEKPTPSDGEKWQERANAFIQYADDYMWSDDSRGRLYLRKRGFTDRTIGNYRLGYCPRDIWDDWGLDKNVWLPHGIVIPYPRNEARKIEKIRIRRLDWTPDDQTGKYIPPAGVTNCAYLTRRIRKNDYVVIVESELDSIMLKQEVTYDRVIGMATGGTHGAKWLKYLAMLALAKKVVVAFDSDDAGEKASQYWINALPNAVRHVPSAHDICDMVLAGHSVHQWLTKAVS